MPPSACWRTSSCSSGEGEDGGVARIFITGANGFIGSRLAARLAAEGHELRGLVRRGSDTARLEGVPLERVEGDVRDRASLEAAAEGARVVVHAAARVSDWGSTRAFRSVNVEGTRRAAAAALRAGARRFVFVSSAAVHGFKGGRNMAEDAPMPATPFPYCESKRAAERWLATWATGTSMEITVLRPGNVFGPGDRLFMAPFLRALARGRMGYIDHGRTWTCPAYVDNVVEGIVRACFLPAAAGEAFLFTDGLDIDWRTFTERFALALGRPAPRLSLPFRAAYGAAWVLEQIYRAACRPAPPLLTRYRVCNGGRDYHFSVRKAARLLGYRPLVSLEEAVERTVDWFRKEKNP